MNEYPHIHYTVQGKGKVVPKKVMMKCKRMGV